MRSTLVVLPVLFSAACGTAPVEPLVRSVRAVQAPAGAQVAGPVSDANTANSTALTASSTDPNGDACPQYMHYYELLGGCAYDTPAVQVGTTVKWLTHDQLPDHRDYDGQVYAAVHVSLKNDAPIRMQSWVFLHTQDGRELLGMLFGEKGNTPDGEWLSSVVNGFRSTGGQVVFSVPDGTTDLHDAVSIEFMPQPDAYQYLATDIAVSF